MDIAAEESAKSESRNSSKNSNISGTPKSGSSVKFSNTKELVIVRKDSPPKLPSATTKADHGVLEKGGSFPERTRPKSAVIDGTTRSSVVGQREISRKMVAASGRKNDVEDDDDDINIEMKPATSRPSDVLWSTSVREFLETQKTPSEELAAKPIPVEKVGSKQSRKSIGERGEGIRLRSDSKEVKKKQGEEAGGEHAKERQPKKDHAKERQPKKDHRKKRDSRSAESLKKGTQRRSEDKVRERLVESLKYASSGATVHRKAKIKEPSTSGAAMSLEGTSDMTMSPTSALSGFSSLGFSFSEISSKTEMIEEEIEFTAAQGYDDNIQFEKSSTDSDLSCIDSEETEEPTDSSFSGLDTTVTPFNLMWTFGMNTRVPFMNLTESNKHNVFFTASHEGVLYDYEEKQMILLQGHQNAITSASMDIRGKYLVTADSGPENSIIVWRMSKCKPVCTIFNANPGSGTAILTMSPNGKYIVSVTSDMPAIIKLWVWSTGSDQPVDTYRTDPTYGKPIGVVFNLTVQERFMVTFKRQIVFMKYHIAEKKFIEPRIPEIRNKSKLGKITDSCYLAECHDCFASTNEGYVMVLGNTYYKTSFNIDYEYDAWKIFITAVKVSTVRLNTINSCDGVVVTGDGRGHIKFYDRSVRLLYWCQNFNLPGVHRISFNRDPRRYLLEPSIEDLADPLEKRIPINRKLETNDVSEQYEIIYRNMVPSDATLYRAPFIVRDFIVGTDDGNMVKIDYINNECEELLVTAETPVAGIDVHDDMPYLVIAYRNGRVTLYDYVTHNMIHSAILPPMATDQMPQSISNVTVSYPLDEKSSDCLLSKSVTCIKFSPKCYHLAVGRGNGELFFLQPILLHAKAGYPLRKGSHSIMKLTFSRDFKYFAYYDKNRTVYLFYYDADKDMWLIVGKNRAHTKELTDLLFSPFNPPELYSIGFDKCLVKYDIANSITNLSISTRKKIDQTANPNCILFYPLQNIMHFLIADDQFKLKILHPEHSVYRHVFLGPAYGCYSEAPIKTMSMLGNPPNKYLIFATKKHIGIQKLPPDGNPYKCTGTVGHPYKIHQYVVSSCGKYIFTAGRHDACVLMWQINPEAVENLEKVGGKEIHPYFCLIEGGNEGWLFQEMQNLFYYMQILHQGESTQLPRVVSDYIALTELPDLMRACGFYPTEFEIETMINDVKFRNQDIGHLENEISFKDFIVLYINHRPAHGISIDKLEAAFKMICDTLGEDDEINAEDLVQLLSSKGENFTQDALLRCISILMHFNQDRDDQEDVMSATSTLPEMVNFLNFVHDILGIDMNRTGLN